MKVRELIEKLQEFDSEMEVAIPYDGEYQYFWDASTIQIRKDKYLRELNPGPIGQREMAWEEIQIVCIACEEQCTHSETFSGEEALSGEYDRWRRGLERLGYPSP